MFVWLALLGVVAWAVRGARSTRDRRLALAVSGIALVLAWLFRIFVPVPYPFATKMILVALVTGVVIAVGHHVRKRAMQAVIDGAEEEGHVGLTPPVAP